MGDRIVEITTDGKHLSVYRGFMIVNENGQELTRIALDDIMAVIGCAHGLTYSNNLLVELAKRNALFVFCGSNFAPIGFLWSVEGHHIQSARINAQINASVPKRKQLWKQVIKEKISQQAAVIEVIGENNIPLTSLISKIKSGDPDNLEAQAARRYWQILFGNDFRRDRNQDGINSLLNYGYIVVRSAVARSIMASGLHPSIGIHHRNMYNPMCLVDDIMEPFRPFVDLCVYHLIKNEQIEITSETKQKLVEVLDAEVMTHNGMTSLRNAIHNSAVSLALFYEEKRDSLDYPKAFMALWQS